MKIRNLLLAVVLALFVSSCKGQEQKTIVKKETDESFTYNNKPKGSWKVNKEFDDNGNIIRYDSIYSWTTTDKNNDKSIREMENLMQSYRSLIDRRFLELENDEDLHNFFLKDSIFPKNYNSRDLFGFNSQDLFGRNLNQNFMQMDSIQMGMEKIRSEMLSDIFPKSSKE